MPLSKKKETELYGVVHEEIMRARIKIARLTLDAPNGLGRELDNILSDLSMNAPQKAIDLFKQIEYAKV